MYLLLPDEAQARTVRKDGRMTVRLRTWLRAHPAGRDAGVAATWLLAGLVLWQLGAYRMWMQIAVADSPSWVFLLTLAGMVAVATQRSRLPFLALAAGVAVAGVDLLAGGSLGVVLAFTDLIYAAVKYGSDRGVWIALRIAVAGAIAAIVVLVIVQPEDPAVSAALLQWMLIVAVSGLWGWNVRSEAERTRSVLGEEHAQATIVLRDRIAHDLHDLVANQIAVAGLHIEAARLQAAGLDGDVAPLELSLERAKQGTEQAHLQMRKLISVLTEAQEFDAQGSVDVPGAISRIDALLPAGRALQWEPSGRATLLAGLERMPNQQALVTFRALEELVMNAAKHGVGGVQMRVNSGAGSASSVGSVSPPSRDATAWQGQPTEGLTVEIVNLISPAGQPAAPGTGLGVRGAMMLLDSVGGTLESGEIDTLDRLWKAQFTLPFVPQADPPLSTRPERSSL